jgi:hypothetical protein
VHQMRLHDSGRTDGGGADGNKLCELQLLTGG